MRTYRSVRDHWPILLSSMALFVIALAQSVMAQQINVYFDPGHGQGCVPAGASSCLTGYAEKDANLQVAMTIDTILRSYPYFCTKNTDYYFTRETDICPLWIDRVYNANRIGVGQYISIHHNGGGPSANYTTAFYSETPFTDYNLMGDSIQWGRQTTSLLARKVGLRLAEAMGIDTLHGVICPSAPCDTPLYVLRNTTMPSVLTEASFVSHCPEAHALRDSGRARVEALAIVEGLDSYVDNRGIAVVKNVYSGGDAGLFWIDDRSRSSPHVSVWRQYEQHSLTAQYQQTFPDGSTRTFYRWAEVRDNWPDRRDTSFQRFSYNHDILITVGPEQEYHYYLAFFRGGPYHASFSSIAESLYTGGQYYIPWQCDPGADSTSVAQISIDRSGGTGGYPEVIWQDYFDRDYYRNWTVTGPGTSQGRFRLMFWDYAGNRDSVESELFTIVDCGTLTATDVELTSDNDSTLFLQYECSQDHELSFEVFHWESNAWHSIGILDTSGIAGVNAFHWTLDSSLVGHYDKYRIIGECRRQCGSSGPLLTDTIDVVHQMVNTAPKIIVTSLFENDRNCLEYGSGGHTATLAAYDNEDRDRLTYRWTTTRGHFPGNVKQVTTSCPGVTYYPPIIEEDCHTKSPMRLLTMMFT